MSDRPCTCHPDDNPPVPCPKKYALSECKAAPAVPEGWKLVPVQPTWEMLMAALNASRAHHSFGGNKAMPIGYEMVAAPVVYAAMLAAAPEVKP